MPAVTPRDRPPRRARARVGAADRAARAEEWLADEVELEPEEGAPLHVRWAGGEARDGVVEEVEEHRLLRFRWDDDATGVPSRVEWTLTTRPAARACAWSRCRSCRSRCAGWRAAGTRHHGARPRFHARPRVTAVRRRLRGARRPDPSRGHRPPGAGAAERVARSPASCPSPARRSRSTSPRSTAPASSDRTARAARQLYRLEPGAAGRRDGLDGLRGRSVGRPPRAAGEARGALGLARRRGRVAAAPPVLRRARLGARVGARRRARRTRVSAPPVTDDGH